MKYLELELRNYKRFSLTEINSFKIYFNKPVQLILGSNGSGKSSLLREISVLPPSSSDFNNGGYKKIVAEHENSVYQCESDFSRQKIHSFKKDNVEFNLSGTASIQKELAKQHLNITPDIHELLIGSLCFHKMPPIERRNWFTKLSKTDYQYAFAVYNKFKEEERNLLGSIKVNQNRLIKENSKIITNEEKDIIEENIIYLKTMIDDLLSKKRKTELDLHTSISEIETIDQQIKSLSNYFFKIRNIVFNNSGSFSVDYIKKEIIGLEFTLNSVVKNIDQISTDLSEKQSFYSLLTSSGSQNKNDVNSKILDLNTKILDEKDKLKYNIRCDNPFLLRQSLKTLYDEIFQILTTLSTKLLAKYNYNNFFLIDEHIARLQDRVIYLNETNLKNVLVKEKETLFKYQTMMEDKKTNIITCPECKHEWYRIYNETDLLKLDSQLTIIKKDKIDIKNLIENTENSISELNEHRGILIRYINLKKRWEPLTEIWCILDKIISDHDSFDFVNELSRLEVELDIICDVYNLEKELNELTILYNQLITDSDNNLNSLANSIALLEKDFHEAITKQEQIQKKINILKNNENNILKIKQIQEQLAELVRKRLHRSQDAEATILNKILHEILVTLQTELSDKESQITSILIHNNTIETLNKQIEQDRKDLLHYQEITSALSPTDGLIAKGLLQFIQQFIEQMNKFIECVWLYPLEILPCKIFDINEEFELTYKFPLKMNNNQTVLDISMGSSAMKEIIDLAFRITAMSALNILDHPIYLDEFTSKMDYSHKHAAFKATAELTDIGFEQIFIVSHFHELYGNMKKAEVTVLCDKNIKIPIGLNFNQHVEIIRSN